MAGLRSLVFATALLAGLCAVQGRNVRGIGPDTDISAAPWLAQIHYSDFGPGDFSSYTSCAGTIVGKNKIITAAHCVDEADVADPINKIKISVGATEKKGGQYYEIVDIDVHPDANDGDNQGHDLAVLTTAKPIQFNANVQPIGFVTEEVKGNAQIVGGGWGSIRQRAKGVYATNDDFGRYLRTYPMTKIRNADCKIMVSRVLKPREANSIICAQPVEGTPCKGDSGSGVWVPAQDGKPAQLFGVLNGGDKCAMDSTPLYVDLLSETNRAFLSKHFDLSGSALRTSEDRDDAPQAAFDLSGLFGTAGPQSEAEKKEADQLNALLGSFFG